MLIWSPTAGTLCFPYSVFINAWWRSISVSRGTLLIPKWFPWGQSSSSTSLWCRMAFLLWNQPLARKQCRSSQLNRTLHNQTSEVKHKMHHVVLRSQLKSVIRMQICKTRQSCYNPISTRYFTKASGWFTLQNFACRFHLESLMSKVLNAYLCFKQTLGAFFRLSLNFLYSFLLSSLGEFNIAFYFVYSL